MVCRHFHMICSPKCPIEGNSAISKLKRTPRLKVRAAAKRQAGKGKAAEKPEIRHSNGSLLCV